MFNFKKKGRQKAERFYDALKTHFSPIVVRLGDRLRLRGRIRLANKWATRHPKKLMFNYSAFAVLLFGFTLLVDGYQSNKKSVDTLGLKSIPSMSHRLQSLNNTEIQHERIRQEVNALGQKGMIIYNELDSLMKLPVKTHTDSIRIVQNYKILNKTFNANGHEPETD